MNRLCAVSLACVWLLLLGAAPPVSKAAGPATPTPVRLAKPAILTAPADTARAPQVETVTLLIGNRVFPDFHDVQTVPLGKPFEVGESNYTAVAIQFAPDFAIDTRHHRISTRSNVPRNPACQVVVIENGVPQDTSWAFANFPPHFSRRSILSFRLVRIDFANYPPVTVIPDTTSTEKPR